MHVQAKFLKIMKPSTNKYKIYVTGSEEKFVVSLHIVKESHKPSKDACEKEANSI